MINEKHKYADDTALFDLLQKRDPLHEVAYLIDIKALKKMVPH